MTYRHERRPLLGQWTVRIILGLLVALSFALFIVFMVQHMQGADEAERKRANAVVKFVGRLYPYKQLVEDQQLPGGGAVAEVPAFSSLSHLIIVPGHAIYVGSAAGGEDEVPDNTDPGAPRFDTSRKGVRSYVLDGWVLEEYQVKQLPHFQAHISRAIDTLADDPNALLIFSGGKTREKAGPYSEAHSYLDYAMKQPYMEKRRSQLQAGSSGVLRLGVEAYAKDSLENLLYSVCRFQALTGKYPSRVTVVGFPFKAMRFKELHRDAVGLPPEMFHYESVVVAPTQTDDQAWVNIETDPKLDSANALFQKDPFGCSPALADKKMFRNPFNEQHPYDQTCLAFLPHLHPCTPNQK